MLYTILLFLFLPFIALAGASVSVHIKKGNIHWLWFLPISTLSSVCWSLIARKQAVSLSVASAIFDAIYAIAYFLWFVYLGESASIIQWVGASLTIFGVILMCL